MTELIVASRRQTELVDITAEVQQAVSGSGVSSGICWLFVPHTTAAVTINEGADPAVRRDIDSELNKIIPFADDYTHLEGNSAGHIKATLVGASETILIEDGRLLLGTWQAIYFCEFDGPRRRKILVKCAAL